MQRKGEWKENCAIDSWFGKFQGEWMNIFFYIHRVTWVILLMILIWLYFRHIYNFTQARSIMLTKTPCTYEWIFTVTLHTLLFRELSLSTWHVGISTMHVRVAIFFFFLSSVCDFLLLPNYHPSTPVAPPRNLMAVTPTSSGIRLGNACFVEAPVACSADVVVFQSARFSFEYCAVAIVCFVLC